MDTDVLMEEVEELDYDEADLDKPEVIFFGAVQFQWA